MFERPDEPTVDELIKELYLAFDNNGDYNKVMMRLQEIRDDNDIPADVKKKINYAIDILMDTLRK